jgi:KDO2-lipid IV(A) lauroyltransferase
MSHPTRLRLAWYIWRWRLKRSLSRLASTWADRIAVPLLKLIRRSDPDRIANLAGFCLRTIGPLLPEHRVGRTNLIAAFPDKLPAEIERILRGVWDNVGRVAVEFAFLDQLWDYDESEPDTFGRIVFSPETKRRYDALRDDGRPALIFAAHLANWEMPALAARAHRLEAAVLYKAPSMHGIARTIAEFREGSMGTLVPARLDAPFKLAKLIEQNVHVGLLVDQHFNGGLDVTFFGRRCQVNPLLARLARHYDCAIHGTRAIRLPGNRFRLELTEAIEAPRDADGAIDVQGTMQAVTSVVEAWVREHPEQWLWLHRRWRGDRRPPRAATT